MNATREGTGAGPAGGGGAAQDTDELVRTLLFRPEGRRDPYPLYRVLRETAPRHRGEVGVVLSGYDDCLRALREPRLGKGGVSVRDENDNRAGSMLDLDPPEHTRQRRLVSRVFTPQRVEALRPAVTGMVEELVDGLLAAGEVDLMAAFAFPLPVTVIGELLGVPAADRPGFQPLVRDAAATLEVVIDADTAARAEQAVATMTGYFHDLIAERRRQPRDDLVSALAVAPERDETLSEGEVIATAILLFGAGFETTTNLIGNGVLALLRHPDQLQRLAADPGGLAAPAVEELLRWDSPVQLDGRITLEAAELAGHALSPGDFVLCLLGGANRDPGRFEDPERLDLGRSDGGPISFGAGIHHCLGAGLARMEGQVAFSTLVRRCRSMELLVEQPEWRPRMTLRGLASLPVRVGG